MKERIIYEQTPSFASVSFFYKMHLFFGVKTFNHKLSPHTVTTKAIKSKSLNTLAALKFIK